MADKKSMAELLAKLKPMVDKECAETMDNDYHSMTNILKRYKEEAI